MINYDKVKTGAGISRLAGAADTGNKNPYDERTIRN
jgi:hypothetical protein